MAIERISRRQLMGTAAAAATLAVLPKAALAVPEGMTRIMPALEPPDANFAILLKNLRANFHGVTAHPKLLEHVLEPLTHRVYAQLLATRISTVTPMEQPIIAVDFASHTLQFVLSKVRKLDVCWNAPPGIDVDAETPAILAHAIASDLNSDHLSTLLHAGVAQEVATSSIPSIEHFGGDDDWVVLNREAAQTLGFDLNRLDGPYLGERRGKSFYLHDGHWPFDAQYKTGAPRAYIGMSTDPRYVWRPYILLTASEALIEPVTKRVVCSFHTRAGEGEAPFEV